MSELELQQTFGKPTHESRGSNGIVWQDFFLPSERGPTSPDKTLSGVAVRLKDGKVLGWAPAYTVSLSSPSLGRTSLTSSPLPVHLPRSTIGFLLNRDEPSGDIELLVKRFGERIGSQKPDLVITNLTSVEESPRARPMFDLGLTTLDWERLRQLERGNLGQQVLVLVDDILIAAPIINAEASAPEFQLQCPNIETANKIRLKLRSMISQ